MDKKTRVPPTMSARRQKVLLQNLNYNKNGETSVENRAALEDENDDIPINHGFDLNDHYETAVNDGIEPLEIANESNFDFLKEFDISDECFFDGIPNDDASEERSNVKKRHNINRSHRGRFCHPSASKTSSESSSSTVYKRVRKPLKPKREIDYDWLTTEAIDGGPTIPHVLPSFKVHVAYQLWENPELDRGALKTYPRPYSILTLIDWAKLLSDGAKEIVSRSGFQKVSEGMIYPLDMALLSAFVERWQPDTNTFHMPWGEMTILLHDVKEILDVSIEGKACHVEGSNNESSWVTLCDMLGLTPDVVKGSYTTSTCTNSPMTMGGFMGEALYNITKMGTDEQQAQGYLMYLLGSTLFLDKSDGRMMQSLALFVENLEEVSAYSFGAGTLAYLYRQLGISSRAEAKTISGCLTLLQAWIFAYFPSFRPPVGARASNLFGQTYSAMYNVLPTRMKKMHELVNVRGRLDRMKPSDVEWLPWGDRPYRRHPKSAYVGLIQYIEIMEPYHPDRCLRQFGVMQNIPKPMPPLIKHYRPADPTKGYSINLGYGSQHAEYSWLKGLTLDISLYSSVVPHEQTSEDYEAWYQGISHPFLIRDCMSMDGQDTTSLYHDQRRTKVAMKMALLLEPLFHDGSTAEGSCQGWLDNWDEMNAFFREFKN